jgi:fumarate hydratase class II
LILHEAENHFAAQAAIDACVEASGALKSIAVALVKIANDIRWLGSGPRCGLGELRLPATQPGSSIMPAKVNPVMAEMVMQAAAQVIGADGVITFSGTFGAFELNTMLPVVAYNLLQAIELLASASRVFARRCIKGLEADAEKCRSNIEQSLAMCTALAPVIGYDQAAKIAKTAYESGRTVREVALETSGLKTEQIKELLDPVKQTKPGAEVGGSGG